MEIHDVVIQEEAIDDIRKGKAFYCGKDDVLGDYFIECIQSDIESLKHKLMPVSTNGSLGFIGNYL